MTYGNVSLFQHINAIWIPIWPEYYFRLKHFFVRTKFKTCAQIEILTMPINYWHVANSFFLLRCFFLAEIADIHLIWISENLYNKITHFFLIKYFYNYDQTHIKESFTLTYRPRPRPSLPKIVLELNSFGWNDPHE